MVRAVQHLLRRVLAGSPVSRGRAGLDRRTRLRGCRTSSWNPPSRSAMSTSISPRSRIHGPRSTDSATDGTPSICSPASSRSLSCASFRRAQPSICCSTKSELFLRIRSTSTEMDWMREDVRKACDGSESSPGRSMLLGLGVRALSRASVPTSIQSSSVFTVLVSAICRARPFSRQVSSSIGGWPLAGFSGGGCRGIGAALLSSMTPRSSSSAATWPSGPRGATGSSMRMTCGTRQLRRCEGGLEMRRRRMKRSLMGEQYGSRERRRGTRDGIDMAMARTCRGVSRPSSHSM